MKKLLAFLLVAATLVGCTSPKVADTTTTTAEETTSSSEMTTYSVGTGSVTSLKGSEVTDKNGYVQADTTYCTVVLKGDKIVSIYWDVAQNKGEFDATGKLVETAAETPTKKEKGDAYGMKEASPIKKEWFEQIAVLEEYAIGKTIAEVLALPVDDKTVPTDEDFKTSLTIKVGSYLKSLEVASKNLVEVEEVASVATGSITEFRNAEATAEKEGQIQVNTTMATVALKADGTIAYATFDVAQNTGKFDTTGKLTEDLAALQTPTKKEKGDAYGMKEASPIKKEWFEQIAVLEEYAVGKTVADVLALPVDDKTVPTAEDFKTSLTIKVGSYLKALEATTKAVKEVK
ncbi:hypothetical protein EII25_01305 [Erysipelotrichaceae bacterium OH741_COT-311]|nr:hypothetical protein EII25_01305 [Erysipelotrichaceae bacterium OH741_COT-311]